MTITVKFFASLRETLGVSETQLDASKVKTVSDVWTLVVDKTDIPPNTLMAINLEYVESSHTVKDNDEVAFFPPVSGG